MLNVLKYRVATARWYIFFCALVEEKSYIMRKQRGVVDVLYLFKSTLYKLPLNNKNKPFNNTI